MSAKIFSFFRVLCCNKLLLISRLSQSDHEFLAFRSSLKLANMMGRVGQKRKVSSIGEDYFVYIPQSLPPVPALQMAKLYPLLEQANIAIGRLDGISYALPNIEMFIYLYIRKEAVLSSQIEGIQSSLSDLLSYKNEEAPGVPEDDVREVSHYVAAMEHGLKRINEDDFPVCLRLIKEIHSVLLKSHRGSQQTPGEFRRSQNWIGGSRPGNALFVPPPPDSLLELLGDFEKFLHDKAHGLPTLIKAALAHVQFETIHPFLDGNGRLGRLLITFLLCSEGLLKKPLLYLSLYLKTYRQQYYHHLQSVRETGDWESWLKFFLEGVIATSQQVVQTTQELIQLFDKHQKKIKVLGRPSNSALRVFYELQKHPVTTNSKIATQCQLSIPTVSLSLKHLSNLNIVEEISGKERNRIYRYSPYLDVLHKGIGQF